MPVNAGQIDELYNRIEAAIFADSKVFVAVTYKVAEYEANGSVYSHTSTAKHVGKVVSATIHDSSPTKRILLFISGVAEPLEIAGEILTDIKISIVPAKY